MKTQWLSADSPSLCHQRRVHRVDFIIGGDTIEQGRQGVETAHVDGVGFGWWVCVSGEGEFSPRRRQRDGGIVVEVAVIGLCKPVFVTVDACLER